MDQPSIFVRVEAKSPLSSPAMVEPELLALQARLVRIEQVMAVVVDALEKVAPHLPVLVSMELGAMASEARSLLPPDGTGPASSDEVAG